MHKILSRQGKLCRDKVIILKERRLSQKKKNAIAIEARRSTDLQVVIDDCIPARKTQSSIATQILGREREGKSGPDFLGIHT